MAHSFGTIYASVVIKCNPDLVCGAVLLEPAAMLCHVPKMAKSFMYSFGPEGLRSPLSVLFRIEPHVAFTLRRHFDFCRYMLFVDDVRSFPAAILVSRGDTIMPSEDTLAHVKKIKNPLVSASHFPPEVGGTTFQEHGGWCHDAHMNDIVFEALQDITRQALKLH